ncbi:helix-turn-helix domain-containing protein [Natronococcus sp. A-GB7]|jgi:predicted DNA binding protein|uniref:helix-turn-helix domain-containing protein n=1 Tax=Natronococcus sp. A-GB7 TaxID=3037649 RepID=UPI00241E39DE|nr:helix-turn-helix domain-containing protein [Natronococcus sp. A-GB7]MDG5819290.1 helix-turn-helix domain-containing protein [Natronococcus sp. A-GB7]
MSTIAEFTIPAEAFALGHTLEHASDLDVEVERVVAAAPETVIPCVRLLGDEETLERADDALAEDPTVEAATPILELEDERCYRIRWNETVVDAVHLLTREQATVLEAGLEGDRWRFRVLFPDREALARSYEFATDQGVPIDLRKINRLEETRHGRFDLTDPQYETLVAALEYGYYDIPREIDMEALSDELEISHQALSERLRRAHLTLVREAVGTDDAR